MTNRDRDNGKTDVGRNEAREASKSMRDGGRDLPSYPSVLNVKTTIAIAAVIVLVGVYLFATGDADLTSRTTLFAQAAQADCHNKDDPIIYWTEGANYVRKMSVGCQLENKIRLNRHPAETESVVAGIGAGNNLRQLAADDEFLYWADMKNHRIMRALRNVNENTCPSDDGCSAIVEGGEIDKPVGIAVEPNGIWIYWSDQSTGVIWRSQKDGTNTTKLLSENTGSPTWLALDGSSLYFTDWLNKRIMKVQTDVESPIAEAVVTKDSMADVGPFDPFGIAVHENWIYWANKAGGKIQKMPIGGDDTIETLFSSTKWVKNPLGLAIDGEGEMIYWASSGGGQQAIRRVSINCVNCVENDVHDMAKWMSNAGHPAGLWVGKTNDVKKCSPDTDPKGRLYWTETGLVKSGEITGNSITDVKEFFTDNKLGDSPRQIVLDDHFVYVADGGASTSVSKCKRGIGRVNKDGTDANRRIVDGMCDASGVALDPKTTEHRWLYFSDKGIPEQEVAPSLWRLDLDEYEKDPDWPIDLGVKRENLSENTNTTYHDDLEHEFEYDLEGNLVSIKNVEGSNSIIQKLMGSGKTHSEVYGSYLALDGDNSWLYWTAKSEIKRADYSTSTDLTPNVVYTDGASWLQGIFVDVDLDRVYYIKSKQAIKWFDPHQATVGELLGNQDKEEILAELGDIGNELLGNKELVGASMTLAFDVDATGKGWMYWGERPANSKGQIRAVYICEDGSFGPETFKILYADAPMGPYSIALDTN